MSSQSSHILNIFYASLWGTGCRWATAKIQAAVSLPVCRPAPEPRPDLQKQQAGSGGQSRQKGNKPTTTTTCSISCIYIYSKISHIINVYIIYTYRILYISKQKYVLLLKDWLLTIVFPLSDTQKRFKKIKKQGRWAWCNNALNIDSLSELGYSKTSNKVAPLLPQPFHAHKL